ncbi:MAG: hypothetical protein JJT96_16020 [Opitutales bacterium]|nr:hypothetical protein [Opitutales bacterium]
MKAAALLWGALVAIMLGYVLTGERLGSFGASVGDLLPDAEDPSSLIAREWVRGEQARQLWGLLEPPPGQADDVAVFWKETLVASPSLAAVYRLDTTDWLAPAAGFWWDNRWSLRFPAWFRAHGGAPDTPAEGLAAIVAERFEAFWEDPDAFGWEDAVRADPLLLGVTGAQVLSRATGTGGQADGSVPFLLEIAGDPLDPAVQDAFSRDLARAVEALRERFPEAVWTDSGVIRFAQANRETIIREVAVINIGVALSVVFLVALFTRGGVPLVFVGATLTGAAATGLTALLFIFPQPHVLALVLGSILLGIGVDYALHVSIGDTRRILFPLLIGFASTLLGYALFLFAPLPLLRQTGVFVTAGLTGALLSAFATRAFLSALAPPVNFAGGAPAKWLSSRWIQGGGLILFGLLLLSAAWRVEWRDDIRRLEVPLPELAANEARIRASLEGDADGRAWLATGRDWREARETLARIAGAEEETLERMAAAGTWIPDPADLPDLLTWLRSGAGAAFADEVLAALEERAFAAEEFAPFVEEWTAFRATVLAGGAEHWDAVVAASAGHRPGPLGLLFFPGGADAPAWFALRGVDGPDIPEDVAERVVPLAQIAGLDAAFAKYRRHLGGVIVLAIAAIGGFLLITLRPARAARTLAVPVGALAAAAGILAWLSPEWNLFHLLGLFLGFCLALDYGLFALRAREAGNPLAASVTLSAATSAAAFLWLLHASVPAVRHFGLSAALCVVAAWILARWLAQPSPKPE